MLNARRANIKEPVAVDKTETEAVEDDNSEDVKDEPETPATVEEDVPSVSENDQSEVDLSADEYIPGQPCRKCGKPNPVYTNSFGRGCNRCLV